MLVASCGRLEFAGRVTRGKLATLVRATDVAPAKNGHPVRADARLAVLWVGLATVLVQINDKRFLTDPVFTPTVGQLSKRSSSLGSTSPGCRRSTRC